MLPWPVPKAVCCILAPSTLRFAHSLCRHLEVAQHFPASMGVDDFIARLEMALAAYGFTGDNAIGELLLLRSIDLLLLQLLLITKPTTGRKLAWISSETSFSSIQQQPVWSRASATACRLYPPPLPPGTPADSRRVVPMCFPAAALLLPPTQNNSHVQPVP